jgi:hypothetical protein
MYLTNAFSLEWPVARSILLLGMFLKVLMVAKLRLALCDEISWYLRFVSRMMTPLILLSMWISSKKSSPI